MKLCPNVQINPYNVYTEDLKKKPCVHTMATNTTCRIHL